MRRPLVLVVALALLVLAGTCAWLRDAAPPAQPPREIVVAPAAVAEADVAPATTERAREAVVGPPCVAVVDADGRPHDDWTVEVRAGGQRAPLALLAGRGADCVEIPAELRAGSAEIRLVARVPAPRGGDAAESEPVVLAPDVAGRLELVVAPPAALVVRVEGPRPPGDLRYEVTPLSLVPARSPHGADFRVTASGEVRFAIAHSVEYGVRVTAGRTREVVDVRAPPVAAGREAQVVARFPAGLNELALSGRVELDGRGATGLWARVDFGSPIAIDVRSDGTFELWHLRGKSVELHAPGLDLLPRFEPEIATYAFGTRDVLVAKRASVGVTRLKLLILEAESGARVPDAVVVLLRRDGPRVREEAVVVTKGSAGMNIPPVDDLEYVVAAADRRDARGFVFADQSPAPGGEIERTIRLERGFSREFRVLHCSERLPVIGADVTRDGTFVGRTDAEGRVLVELDAWPLRLEVRAPGYDEDRWPPSWQPPVGARTILICPAAERR